METKKPITAAAITLGLSLGAVAAGFYSPRVAKGCYLPGGCRRCSGCSDSALGYSSCDYCDDDANKCGLSGDIILCY
jgi:hypothetical protein